MPRTFLFVDHLAEVLHSAMQMALWLFKEPATFRFDWKGPSDATSTNALGSRRRGGSSNQSDGSIDLTMTPGLLKTHDTDGLRIGAGGMRIVTPVSETVGWTH